MVPQARQPSRSAGAAARTASPESRSGNASGSARSATTARVGWYAALVTAVFTIGYSVPQLLWVVWKPDPPWDEVFLFAPSMVFPLSYVVLMAAIADWARPDRKVFGLIALSFSVMYATMVSIVYFVSLAMVAPRVAAGTEQEIDLLLFGDDRFLTAIDALGYGFMSLAALLAAYVFEPRGDQRWVRRALLAHGVLAPAVVLSYTFPLLLAVGVLWVVTGPTAAIMLTRFFRAELAQ
jgi:hypothetical protein